MVPPPPAEHTWTATGIPTVTGDQTLPAVQNTPAENITAAQPLEPPPYPGEQEADQSGVTLAQIRQEVIRRLVEGNENLSFPLPEVGTTSREDMPAMVTAHSSTLDETNELDFPKDYAKPENLETLPGQETLPLKLKLPEPQDFRQPSTSAKQSTSPVKIKIEKVSGKYTVKQGPYQPLNLKDETDVTLVTISSDEEETEGDGEREETKGARGAQL